MRETAICAWCGTTIREGDPNLPVTHGICPPCKAKVDGDDTTCEGCGRPDPDFTDDHGDQWHRRCHRRAHIGPRTPAGLTVS